MGVQTNRMLPRVITISHTTQTTIVGVGREGVLNGGSTYTLTIDGTYGGGASAITVHIFRRATRGGALAEDATTYACAANKVTQVVLTPAVLNEYEIIATAQNAGVGAEDVMVELSIQRGA